MKHILLFFLSLICSGLLLAQDTAAGSFVNSSGIQPIPSLFGSQDLYIFECSDDIVFDGSSSTGEDGYFVEVVEFDLSSWTVTNTLFSDWVCSPCTAPNNIDVLSYFGGQSPQCGQIYKFRLATGPTFTSVDRFFAVDCGNNGVPDVKTFDITRRIHEDTLSDKLDYGLAGIINQNGDYVSIGIATQENTGNLELATVHYDLTGTVSSVPQMGIILNATNLDLTGAEEIVSGATNDGYLAVVEEDSIGEISLVRLDPAGTVSWADQVELSFNGVPLVVRSNDFLIDGDRAVVTGELDFGATTQPFILVYDYVTRSVVCGQAFRLNPGVTTINAAQAIVNNTTNNHYAIAGRTDNDLFYLEVEYDCTFAPTNLALLFPLDAVPATSPIAREILFDPNQGNPVICGTLEGGPTDQIFIQNGTNTLLLDPSLADDVSLSTALFNQQDELILAGQVQGSGEKKGFIAAVDHTAIAPGSTPIYWVKEYADGAYPETNILDLELAADGGYFTVGYGVNQNATGSPNLDFFDTWIMKTDEDGVLMNCNCYEEVMWTSQSLGGVLNLTVVPFTIDNFIINSSFSTDPLQHTAYHCDEWCPVILDDCLVEATATKTANPEDLCCYDLSFFIDPIHADEFTQLNVRPLPGVALTPLASLDPQYSLISNTTGLISLVSNTGNLCNGLDRFFPTGTLPSVELCVDGFNGNMPMIEVDFVKCDGEICSDTLTLDCSPCLEIVNDSLYCDGGDLKYVFDFQNTWDRPIKRLVVNSFAPTGVVFTPDTLFFPAGIPVGGVAGANTICVSNVSAPDSLKFDFKALGDDECCFCISNEICKPIPICCDTCESIEYILTDTIINGEECCYTLDIYHCTDTLFTALRLTALNGVTLSQQSAGPGWSMYNLGLSSSTQQTWFPRPTPIHDTPIPTGWNRSKVNFCLGEYGSLPLPQVVQIEWLGGNDENVVCTDSLFFECELPPSDSTCALVTDTTWSCNPDGSYDLDLKVQIKWPDTAYQVYLKDFTSTPPGAVFTPDPLVLNGVFAPDSVVMMPTLNVSNLSPGDTICFDLALADTLDQYINECCHVEVCLVVPPIVCCETCESIEYELTDTIINGEECCYSLDFYSCTDSLFTALRLTALNGVTLSQQSAGATWSMYGLPLSSSTQQTWFPRPTPIHATNIPTGWTRNEVNFCLGNYDGRPLPQVVKLEWLGGSDQNVVCTDSLFFECEVPPSDSTCAQVVDTDWICNPDGSYDLDLDVQINWQTTAYRIRVDSLKSFPPGAIFNPDTLGLSGVFLPNSVVTMPTLKISNVTLGDSICFDLALSDTLVVDSTYANECCYVEVCLVVECPDTGNIDCDSLGLPIYDHARLGWAAATCFSSENSGYVMGLIDVRNNNTATRGMNWPAPMQHFPAFTADTLGQIFGLAVDEGSCMYVTASSVYGNFGWGVAGSGGVYKLCPDGGGTYHLSNSTTLSNNGSGLGQVTYDPVHQQIFVSNFHDGIIYRLNAITLAPLGSYDFPGYVTAPAVTGPDFVALGERVWAVEYNPFDSKLYFSIWGEDQRNMGTVATNQLWSIDVNSAGAFSGTASYVLDLPGRDYGGTNFTQNTMPISDLAFSKAGRMLVTERTMDGEHTNAAHGGRTFSYEWDGTSWVNPQLQHIGVAFSNSEHANSSGGVDFGYLDNLEGCDSMIWNTADALQFSPDVIYGMQGHEWPGNSNVSSDPDFVSTNSILIDLDGNTGSQAKTQYGDVEIFRDPCCGEATEIMPEVCEQWETTVRTQGFDIQQLGTTNTIVMTPPAVMTASDWWTLNVNCAGFGVVTNAGDRSSNLGTNGNYLVCIDAYRVVNGDTCHVSFTYDGSINIGPGESCLPATEFEELWSNALKINRLDSRVVIYAPGLPLNCELTVDFKDESEPQVYTLEQLPIIYDYQSIGDFRPKVTVVEYDGEEACNLGTATANLAAVAIGLKLFPNPNHGNFQLDFELPLAGDFTVAVFDMTGRKVLASQHHATAGRQQLGLDVNKLPPGTYVLRMVGSGFVAAAKFQRMR